AWHLSPLVKLVENVDEIYFRSDFITIHVPAMDSTKGMINAEAIAKMRDGVKILNFARDVLINEEDLGAAIANNKVAKYISDFPNNLSVNLNNAIVLPHLGASTEEAEENCAVMAAEELQDYLDNGNITNSVNFPDLNAGICVTEARVAILNRNIPNMLSQITAFFGNNGLNIENLQNKGRGKYAYTLLDISHRMPDDTVDRLKEIDGVLRVRRVAENHL
ncbi:MAG: 3-phosphoglycerate dehydrogenase, partial [Synergistaceae bacterium]|nr:3-phosphoglycerate dehydrogenase [Synergistaceae bacterium]